MLVKQSKVSKANALKWKSNEQESTELTKGTVKKD